MADSFLGHVLHCSQCGEPFHTEEEQGEVIEGHAEPIGPAEPGGEVPEEALWSPAVRNTRYDEAPGQAPAGFYQYRFERRFNDNSGCCCGMGCALMLFFMLVFLRGCAAILF